MLRTEKDNLRKLTITELKEISKELNIQKMNIESKLRFGGVRTSYPKEFKGNLKNIKKSIAFIETILKEHEKKSIGDNNNPNNNPLCYK